MINKPSKELEYEKIPIVTQELVKFLDQNFPEQCASLTETVNEIYYRSGQRSVVVFLKTLYMEQIQ